MELYAMLEKYVALLTCLSLLIVGCSKSGNSRNGQTYRFGLVHAPAVATSAHHVVRSAPAVGFWNREIGNVAGFSVTPKRMAIGAGTVVETAVTLFGLCKWHKWWTKPAKMFRTVGSNTAETLFITTVVPGYSETSAPFVKSYSIQTGIDLNEEKTRALQRHWCLGKDTQ
jgi:hypothetical protein